MWQQTGTLALLDLLSSSLQSGLPPIPWTVLTVGSLLGRADSAADVCAWASWFDVPVVRTDVSHREAVHRCTVVWRAVSVTVVCD